MPPTPAEIPADVLPRLGKVPDRVLAREIGWVPSKLRRARQRLGIAPVISPIGDLPPSTVALLGTMSDADVARRVGLCSRTVCNARTRLGIPAYRRPRKERTPAPARSSKPGKLGELTDEELLLSREEIVALIGQDVTASGIGYARRRRGLESPPRTYRTSRPGRVEVRTVPVRPAPKLAPAPEASPPRPAVVAVPEVVSMEPPADDAALPAWFAAQRRRGAHPYRLAMLTGWTVDEVRAVWGAA